MTRSEAIRFFGSQAALAKSLGIGRASVNNWGEQIPLGRQYQLEVLTGGALKADRHPPVAPGLHDVQAAA